VERPTPPRAEEWRPETVPPAIVSSGRARAGIDDRPDVLATQRRSKPAGNESVHDLHALDVPRVRMTSRSARSIGSVPWNFKRNAGRLTTGSVGGRDGTIECDLAMGQMAHISAQSDPRPL
jgi:hypothetical protein